MRSWDLDGEAVRAMCAEAPAFGLAIAVWVGLVVTDRLHASRIVLMDLYAPHGGGGLT
ncbi:hypothetical protein ACWGDS_07470 [Streptomyces sp. NPDC055059]|uniref:hypothetical protein n=1 Tax=unclassified Streptomyces TaxID=2593676 RepID=UPI002B1CAD46|nr:MULTISPECIES: hypothetical protein [unclassified Streptomyces]